MTLLAIAIIYTPIGYAQNLTTNASNMMGNASANVNKTASELAKNDTLGNVLNKTGEVGKKIQQPVGRMDQSIKSRLFHFIFFHE